MQGYERLAGSTVARFLQLRALSLQRSSQIAIAQKAAVVIFFRFSTLPIMSLRRLSANLKLSRNVLRRDLPQADFWPASPAVRLTHNFRVARSSGSLFCNLFARESADCKHRENDH